LQNCVVVCLESFVPRDKAFTQVLYGAHRHLTREQSVIVTTLSVFVSIFPKKIIVGT